MKYVIATLALVALLIIAVYFNDCFIKWNGALGVISFEVLIVTWLVKLGYSKDRRLYFLIQRILLLFRHTDTTWFFNISFGDVSTINSEHSDFWQHIATIVEKAWNGKVFVEQSLANRCDLVIDKRIHMRLRYDSMQDAALTVEKILVPKYRYKEYAQRFADIFEQVSRSLGAGRISCSMHIEFGGKNPYLGYFLRHVPGDHLKDFHCTFIIKNAVIPRIEVSKKEMIIITDGVAELFTIADKYLSLSGQLIPGENQ
jgi:hypothetical protein